MMKTRQGEQSPAQLVHASGPTSLCRHLFPEDGGNGPLGQDLQRRRWEQVN